MRQELFNTVSDGFDVTHKPLGFRERVYDSSFVRKTVLLVALAATWELYATFLGKPLLFPRFSETIAAFFTPANSAEIPAAAAYSIALLLKGYGAGVLIAAILTAFASVNRIGADLLETLTAMFNPLPSIALLPLSMIWFGLGDLAVIFVLIHAVLWAVALNAHSGFRAVSPTLRMVGRNYGLSGLAYIRHILIPGAFPSILTGLKVGWSFAWRTLIAAELVFGVSSGSGGLGWFIYENKNELNTPAVFAGLLTVIAFGLLVDHLIFRTIERTTVRRWGMESQV